MDPSQQILLRAGMLPMKTQRVRWFLDPNFSSLVRPPPEVPELDVTIALDDGKMRVLAQQSKGKTITAADVEPELEDADVE